MTPMLALITVFIFIYGIVIGSFLNVCIYRIPQKEDIVLESSHCMSCGHRLKWYDLALNGILYVVVFYATDFSWDSILYCLMTSALIVLSVIDYRTYEIPFGINVFLFVLGVIRCVFGKGDRGTLMIGFFAVSLFLLLLSLLTRGAAIGGGDIKLMAAAGLLLGWKLIILAFVMGCIAGSVVHLFRMKVCGAGRMLALGPYLSVGIFIAALWGNGMIDWYLGLFM